MMGLTVGFDPDLFFLLIEGSNFVFVPANC
jgi:hypothetical protein